MERTCTSCGAKSPAGAKFCMTCGTALGRVCDSCGIELPEAARFCFSCGAAVAESPSAPLAKPPAAAAPLQPAALPEERRQVTVLFADLSGYTSVAEGMDPEAVKDLIARCLERLAEAVTEHGGTVDKYIGDNVMATFGAPVAHEDDPERAVRAGLAMQAAMPELNRRYAAAHDAVFKLRVGINTGEVLAGAVGDRYTVTGDTVNVASRLESAAQPGTVIVGERTAAASSEAIEFRELAPLELKGKAKPVRAWEAVGLTDAIPVRRRAAAKRTPFVGRDRELDLLESMYERVAREGRAQLVTLIGQAGVGKSRMLLELRERLAAHPSGAVVHTGRCLAYGSGIVFWALGEVIRKAFGIVETDSAEVAWTKLSEGVEDLLSGEGDEHDSIERRSALIARLLGIEVPDDQAVPDEDPERMREAYFSAIRALLEAMALRNPLVLAFEDIHWADQGMLDLIEYVAQWVRGPMFIVCLTRDELLETRPNWGSGQRNASSIALDPLDDQPTRDLVAGLLGNGSADSAAVALIVERAGGNPFFAEEMARRIESSGGDALELPETVHGLLTARLDSLDPVERRLLQQGSVVGQTFSVGLLAELESSDPETVRSAVGTLERKDLVLPIRGSGTSHDEVAFKHVLIRDVAYATLPKAVRCRRHFEVGRILERRAGDRTEEVVALLAEHFGRAAMLGDEVGLDAVELAPMTERAFSCLEAAGDAAAAIYSNQEAFDDYESARRLRGVDDKAALARLSEKQADVGLRLGRADAAVELWEQCLEYHRFEENLPRVGDLHRKVGAGLWHKGESKQAIEHYQRGINLLKDGPPCLELVRLYEEAAALYMRTGDNMLAIYAAEKALRLAERLDQRLAAGRAHGIFGRVFGRIGDAEQARTNLERSVELAREESPAETIRALLTLGDYLEMSQADYVAAEATYGEALSLARRLGDLPAQVELQAALAVLAVYRADWSAAAELAAASAELAEREGLVGKLAYPIAVRGLLAWRDGRGDDAERDLRRAHSMAERVGWSEVSFTALLCTAIVQRDRDELAGAVGSLDAALDVCERAGLIAQSIQAMSLRAELLMLDGRAEAAREAASEASRMAERLPYPIGQAAALEAEGVTAPDDAQASKTLASAQDRWAAIGRPLDAARCGLHSALRAAAAGETDGAAALEAAAAEFERLEIRHLAARARERATAFA